MLIQPSRASEGTDQPPMIISLFLSNLLAITNVAKRAQVEGRQEGRWMSVATEAVDLRELAR